MGRIGLELNKEAVGKVLAALRRAWEKEPGAGVASARQIARQVGLDPDAVVPILEELDARELVQLDPVGSWDAPWRITGKGLACVPPKGVLPEELARAICQPGAGGDSCLDAQALASLLGHAAREMPGLEPQQRLALGRRIEELLEHPAALGALEWALDNLGGDGGEP
jgi:hypothetical protein